jgi:hypothetical protein
MLISNPLKNSLKIHTKKLEAKQIDEHISKNEKVRISVTFLSITFLYGIFFHFSTDSKSASNSVFYTLIAFFQK